MRSALLVSFVLLALYGSALAQQPSVRPYESEEDLWEARHDGEITFDEFIELLDLARAGADSLLSPPSDWEALPGSEAGYLAPPSPTQELTQPDDSTPSRVDIPWVASIRSGIDADLNEPTGSDGYSVVRLQRGRWRGVLDFEHDRDDGGTWRRRSLIWRPRKLTFIVGSFEPRLGRGLVIGRRSRVIKSSDREGDIAHPTLARYDGLFFATNSQRMISTEMFISGLTSERLHERVAALQLAARFGRWGIGTSIAGGRISRPDSGLHDYFDDTAHFEDNYGLNLSYNRGKGEILGEVAVNGNGASAKAIELLWPLSRGRFHARAWSYGAGYINPWSGGPGHSDTRPILIDTLDYTFSSRTAGERGFDFTTRVAATSNVKLRWDWMSHREEPGAKLEHSGVFRAEIKQPAFRTTPFIRAQIDEDESESFSLGNYLWWGPKERELNVRLEFGTHYDDEVQFIRAGLGAKLQLNRIVRFAPAIRWVDPNIDTPSDGYWYFYFTEAVLPIQCARVEMALVWKKFETASKDDLVELRVRAFVR